jgi:photosystem II stability/assembly factor-like uncharacterized protein
VYVDHVVTGTQWVSQTVPGPMGANSLVGITCSTKAECIIQANNNQILGTPDAGNSWVIAQPEGGPFESPNGMNCNAYGCVAAVSVSGGDQGRFLGIFDVSGWGSASGDFPFKPPTLFTNGEMSCTASGLFCALIVSSSRDGGRLTSQTWISRLLVDGNNETFWNPVSTMAWHPGRPDPPQQPSCPLENRCFAYGFQTIWSTVDGGVRWRPAYTLPQHELLSFTSISCASASDCMAGTSEGSVAVTDDRGRTWTLDTIPGWCTSLDSQECGSVVGLDCVTNATCYAGSGDYNDASASSQIDVTSDAGKHWTSMSMPQTSLSAIACARANDCWAVGSSLPVGASTSPVILHLG